MFLETALFTGSGQFIELINSQRSIGEVTREEIYRTYDLKTAYYTFAGPLASGAVLGGATDDEANNLFRAGILLGRAFQIRDDILDIFQDERISGKNAFSDVMEAKKTLLLWYAYRHCGENEREFLDGIISRPDIGKEELMRFRDCIVQSGSLLNAEKEVRRLVDAACSSGAFHSMNRTYAACLEGYTRDLLLSPRNTGDKTGSLTSNRPVPDTIPDERIS
jgi:geranylgeranyl diphosphate synthase type I